MNVCITVGGLGSEQVARLQAALRGHVVTICTFAPEAEKRAAVAAAEVVFGNVPALWLNAAVGLRWVQLDSAGVDAYLKINDTPRAVPVLLTNLSGFYDRAVAEGALAGILALYRQLPRLLAAQTASRWVKTAVEPDIRSLDGNVALLLGAGSIGQRVAHLLAAFDVRCRFFSRTPRPGGLQTLAELASGLATTDLLINTLPHTPETIGFISRERLSLLKRGAVVVNVGRGSTLDETALVDFLDSGHLGGAVLDVTAVEPLPVSSPLWGHSKVLLTQHTGGRFPAETDRKIEVFLSNVARFEKGVALAHRVELARGY